MVEQIGEGVDTDLRVGERVMAIVVPLGQHGAYAERVVVPAASVVRSPSMANDAEAATIPMNGLTVRQALDALALEPGQTLAVTGAAGAVGGYAVQMGKAAGLGSLRMPRPATKNLSAAWVRTSSWLGATSLRAACVGSPSTGSTGSSMPR